MVVLQRNEVSRNRLLYILTIILSAVVLAGIIANFSQRSEPAQAFSLLVGAIAVVAVVLSLIQLLAHPKRSQVLLFQRDDEMVVATNALHEGFKLRFLRDILGEHVSSFTDEDRAHWKSLEDDGFYAALYVRNVRKLIMLRLCTVIFHFSLSKLVNEMAVGVVRCLSPNYPHAGNRKVGTYELRQGSQMQRVRT